MARDTYSMPERLRAAGTNELDRASLVVRTVVLASIVLVLSEEVLVLGCPRWRSSARESSSVVA